MTTCLIRRFAFGAAVLFAAAGLRAEERPERHAVFSMYPLTTIKPQGWMRKWLEIQQAGLTGHLADLKGRCFQTMLWGNENLIANPAPWVSFGVQGQWHEALMWFSYL